MSLSTGQVPLMSADWSSTNDLLVGAVARDDWIIWDMSKSRFNSYNKCKVSYSVLACQ